MHTLFVTVALIAAAPTASWDSSYSRGQEQGIALKKPLIVVFGRGSPGWESIIRAEKPNAEVSKLLGERFVRVFADTSTPAGKQLARDFEFTEDVGFVISDKTGSYQAIWHQGDLPNQSFAAHLEKYSDPTVVVRRTDAVIATKASPSPVPAKAVEPIKVTPAPAVTPTVAPNPVAVGPSPSVVAVEHVAAPSPAWQKSYGRGQEVAAAEKKPLAIVFGSGPRGWASVAREQTVKPEVTQVLNQHYVCVFIDTATPAGKTLAQDFSISSDTGMVISDRSGETQAFWHQGSLTSDHMTHYLAKYADPQVVVRGTETTNPPRPSYYPTTYGSPGVSRTISSGNC